MILSYFKFQNASLISSLAISHSSSGTVFVHLCGPFIAGQEVEVKRLKTSLGGYIVKNYLCIPVLLKRFVTILIVTCAQHVIHLMSFEHFLKTVKIQNPKQNPVSKVLYHFKEEKHKFLFPFRNFVNYCISIGMSFKT